VSGFLLLPVFFAVTMIAALMPADSGGGGGGAPPDPCAPDFVATTTTEAPSDGGGSAADTMNTLALLVGTVATVFLVVGNLNTKWIKDMPAEEGKPVDDDEDAFGGEECREALAIVPLLVVVNIGFNLSYNAMNNAFPASRAR
jgi:hypothetical protein